MVRSMLHTGGAARAMRSTWFARFSACSMPGRFCPSTARPNLFLEFTELEKEKAFPSGPRDLLRHLGDVGQRTPLKRRQRIFNE
jgi:hypothetical protein